MRIYKEIELRNFEAWSGAVDTMETLEKLEDVTNKDAFDTLEFCLDDMGEGMDETEVNDFLWFENDTIADWLGYSDWEELKKVAEGKDELKYEVGDFIIMTNGIEAEIIEVDADDMTYPYHVKYHNEDDEIVKEWIEIDEIEE